MERFGRYELEEKLGEGGMAEVFRARRRSEDGFVRTVCIKRLLPHVEADEAMARAFGDEARIMASLHHPSVVDVFEFGRHEGRSFLAMELVEGTDLRRVLRRTGPLPVELAVYVAHELATALAHAHASRIDGVAQRVVHRDVTPSNVLLSVDGAVKLADFGIAKATTRAQVTQHGIVKGKVPYMSPEQAVGQQLDQRSDLFALGVVLYECVAGRRPYDGPTDLDTFRNVQSGVHAPLDHLVPATPPRLVALIHSLLRPRAEHRPAHAGEVIDVLSTFPITLGARRAIAQRVLGVKAQGAPRRAPVRAAIEPLPAAPPASLVPAGETRAVRRAEPPASRRHEPSQTLTERMSPTVLAACFSATEGARARLPATADPTTERVRRVALTRPQLVALTLLWVTFSSILGGLAAELVTEPEAPPAVAIE